ncbi:hypothetical protein DFJ74DRAFT_669027 [Hyaloraphidium curvatum]|nr:hypothetical protein DFJ74DRAFT_669027 [Hyaloraphidium curvatum]
MDSMQPKREGSFSPAEWAAILPAHVPPRESDVFLREDASPTLPAPPTLDRDMLLAEVGLRSALLRFEARTVFLFAPWGARMVERHLANLVFSAVVIGSAAVFDPRRNAQLIGGIVAAVVVPLSGFAADAVPVCVQTPRPHAAFHRGLLGTRARQPGALVAARR